MGLSQRGCKNLLVIVTSLARGGRPTRSDPSGMAVVSLCSEMISQRFEHLVR
jgi:hypothetical protein